MMMVYNRDFSVLLNLVFRNFIYFYFLLFFDYLLFLPSKIEKMLLEVCAGSVQSALHAALGGASRIELCQNLNEGGTTPSYATIQYCVKHLPLKTFVLIRPRAGNFCYTDVEYEIMINDIKMCKLLGVAGIVTGFLHEDGKVDKERTAAAVQSAWPLEVTFHRAFDECTQWQQALEDIIACGCRRILTSGFKATAEEGIENLKAVVKWADSRIIILPGSGINSYNVVKILTETGATEIHGSCKGQNGVSEVAEIKRICSFIDSL
ncbi:MAG: copper homeostasis protein CutC [Bacteroidales bacterium]